MISRLLLITLFSLTSSFGAPAARVTMPLSEWVKTCPSVQIADDLLEQVNYDSKKMVLETIGRSLPRFNLNYSQRAFVDVNATQLSFAISGNVSNPWLLSSDIETQKQMGAVETQRVKEEKLNQELTLIEAFLDRKAQAELVEVLESSESYLKKWANTDLSDTRLNEADFVLGASEILFALQVAKRKVSSYDSVFSKCSATTAEIEITLSEPTETQLQELQKKAGSVSYLGRVCEPHRNLEESRLDSTQAQWIPSLAYGLTDPIYTTRNVRQDWWVGLQFSIPLASFSQRTSLVSNCELKTVRESLHYLSELSEAQAAQSQIRQFKELKNKLQVGLAVQIPQIEKGTVQPTQFMANVNRFIRLQNQLAKLESKVQTAMRKGREL